MAGYDGAGSLFALGLRLTKLDASGAPLVGANNCYVTDALVQISFGLSYSDPDAIELTNGAGVTCVYYQPPPALLSGTIEDFQVCTPDPNIMQFLCGGSVINDTATPANQIGYQAPAVNVDPTPNGVAIEAWSRAILNNSYAANLPYFHWVVPRAKVTPSESMVLGAEDPATPQLEGTCEENGEFGDGPIGDIEFPTNRVWQFCRVPTMPTLTPGFVAVTADESS